MKRYFIGVLLLGLLNIATFANDIGSQWQIGYDRLNIDNIKQNGNGGNVGWNFILPLTILNGNDLRGPELGLGWELGVGAIDLNDNGNNEKYSHGNLKILTGYHYKKIYFRAGIGYGFFKTILDNSPSSGHLFNGQAGYKINNKFGLQFHYKRERISYSSNSTFNIEFVGINLIIY